YARSDWLAPVLSVMHERQFDWLTHALPLENLNIVQLLLQAKHETQRTGTQRSHNSVRQKVDVTPFKVNGDPSTLTDQRIPTRSCERSLSRSAAIGATSIGAHPLGPKHTKRVFKNGTLANALFPMVRRALRVRLFSATRCVFLAFFRCA